MPKAAGKAVLALDKSMEGPGQPRSPTATLLFAHLDEAMRSLRDDGREAIMRKIDRLRILTRRHLRESHPSVAPCSGTGRAGLDEAYRQSILQYVDRLAAGDTNLDPHQLFVRLRLLDYSLTAYVSRDDFRQAYDVEGDEEF
jgi:hypothetical protein